jgi:uncharacterized membrane protein (UPF0127 family)
MKPLIVLIALAILLISGCVTQPPEGQFNLTRISIGNGTHSVTLYVEIAATAQEQTKGLMYRTSLPEDQGMLFVFEPEQEVSFWMKNTLIPLDMIFIDGSGRVTRVMEDVPPCQSGPCPTYPSGGRVKYVLEANAGWASRHSVTVGTILETIQ